MIIRRLALCAILTGLAGGGVQAATYPVSGNVTVSVTVTPPPLDATNTMRLSDKAGTGETNYPWQFGRPFLPGTIPHFPQIMLAGTPVPTQADVKNRWPDGSVKFAVLATVVPAIPAGGSVAVSFQDQASGNNAALTVAQMLAAYPDFDASLNLTLPGMPQRLSSGTWVYPATSWIWGVYSAGYPHAAFTLQVDGAPVVVGPVNTSTIAAYDYTAFNALFQTALRTATGVATATFAAGQGSTWRAQITVPGHTAGFASAPPAGMDDMSTLFALTAATGAAAVAAIPAGASVGAQALAMLQAGKYRPWTSGAIAQTVEIADDAGGYDLSTDGQFHPIRPRWFATFWPAPIGRVALRIAVENSKTTEAMDALYSAAITLGHSAPASAYTADLSGGSNGKRHWAGGTWTKEFWLGGTPEQKVNIDYNIAYLVSTRFIPNFDATLVLPESAIANQYRFYTDLPHDILDGAWDGGIYTNEMSGVGGRPELGTYPSWALAFAYTGDWRLRQMSLGMADLAGAFPANSRESKPGNRLSRYDAAGSGSGVGHTISVTDRRTLVAFNAYILYYDTNSAPADRIIITGPLQAGSGTPWTFDGSHQPSPFYIPYLLTGDPWYLGEMYMWAGFSAVRTNGRETYDSQGRGPTGAEGALNDETRGEGWQLRNRAETAFIAPDADPEKAYFTYLTNDDLARAEGMMNVTGSAYQSAPPVPGSTLNMWHWGRQTGANHVWNGIALPTHAWDSYCQPNVPCDASVGAGTPGSYFTSDVGSNNSPWMDYFLTYAFYRAKELGFAAGPIASWKAYYTIGLINQSGLPELVGMYRSPTAYLDGTPIPDFPKTAAAINPAFDVKAYFAAGLAAGENSYTAPASAAAALASSEPGGAQAWAWALAKIYPTVANNGASTPDPRWAIVPRTDTNVLPAIPP